MASDPEPTPVTARVLVVSVNYRTAERAVNMLASLAPERALVPNLAAVVVDNASGDGSARHIGAEIGERGWGEWARVLPSDVNGGFAFGNNLATKAALESATPPDYVLFLNPDCEIYPGAVHALTTFLEEHDEAGVVGPYTEIGRGNLRQTAFRFHGVLNSLDEGLHFGPVSRLLARFCLSPPPQPTAHPCDWVSGGCMLVRRRVFEEVGLMDEDYFLYFEEVDFMLRANRAGFSTWYEPKARIVHFAGASTGVTGGHELARPLPCYWFESRRRYFLKNHGWLKTLLANLAWTFGNALYNLRRAVSSAPRVEPPRFFRDFVRFNFLGQRWSDEGRG
jgi:GT2 family glycosyltransferase